MTPSPAYLAAKSSLAQTLAKAIAYIDARYGPVKAASVGSRYASELHAIASDEYTDEEKKRDAIIALLILFALLAFEEGQAKADIEFVPNFPSPKTANTTTAFIAAQTAYAAGLAQAMQTAQVARQAVKVAHAQVAALQANPAATPEQVQAAQDDLTDAVDASAQAKAEVDRRIDMWEDTMGTMVLAGAASGGTAETELVVRWVLGPTEEHCHSEEGKMGCFELSGQEHPLSFFIDNGYIPRHPGNHNITCGGWRCLCKLVRVDSGVQII